MNRRTKSLLGLLALSLVGFAVLTAQTVITTDGLVESTSGGFKFPDGTIQTTAVENGVAPVADTGQQSCSDAAGEPIACAGTGQDGEYQAGVVWANPRLVDNGDGTITDLMTGLMWLQDAGCLSVASWEKALAKIDDFNSTAVACTNYAPMTYSDWRLPNIREYGSLVDFGQDDPALPAGSGFIGVVTKSFYWASTSATGRASVAWAIGMSNGESQNLVKTSDSWVWAVRAGE